MHDDEAPFAGSEDEKHEDCLLKDPSSAPKIAKIFSAYESIRELRKIHLPIHHTISIEPKTAKTVKFMSISTNEHFVIVVDMESNLFIYNPKTKKIQLKNSKSNSNSLHFQPNPLTLTPLDFFTL